MHALVDQGVSSLLLSLVNVYDSLWRWSGGLAGFALLLAIDAAKRDRRILVRLYLAATLPGVVALLLYVVLPPAISWHRGHPFHFVDGFLTTMGVEFAAGLIVGFIFLRHGAQLIDKLKTFATVKTAQERNRRTDVRDIHKSLPKPEDRKSFDPRRYFNERRGMFIGLDERNKAIYMSHEDWRMSHVLLSGRTRSGKGVAAQTILSQAIRRREFVCVLDPKGDDWLPHILYAEAQAAGVPHVHLDLRQSAPPQINLFAGCDADTLENMLIGAFGLSEKGEAADFYRLADRTAARECARWLAQNPNATAADAVAALGSDWLANAPAFHKYMVEMAEIPAVNRSTAGGIDLVALERSSGCLYTVGDMINPRIIRLQKMLLIRLLFLAKNRDYLKGQPRTITVFADEFKTHLSRPFITALGAAAGWGLHAILAFQSFQDLADCPADLDKDAVRGAVMENCAVQLSYVIKDIDTAEYLAASTGTVLVDDETRRVAKNLALSETVDGERTLRQAERYLIDVNMLTNLPKGCSVLKLADQLAQFCFTSPVPAARVAAAITPTHADTTAAQADSARSLAEQTVALEPMPEPADHGRRS